mmetsp:Transcript_21119/g.45183  ORF Transcript_21119/g.45183 Transcript_21119/m.45183 type:complete len:239 (+) Transcript_21119:466-1182(+)
MPPGTALHRSLGAFLESLNSPLMRSHISFPGRADVPRNMNSPIKTGVGIWVRTARGLSNSTHAPMREWMERPVTRCSIVLFSFPAESRTERARTWEMLRTVAATSQGNPIREVRKVKPEMISMSACIPSSMFPLRRPFSILYWGLFTNLTVIFWSKNSNTVAMSAGRTAPQRAQTGRSSRGTSHGLPLVVANVVGMARAGRVADAPWESLAQRAMRAPVRTPRVGPKFDTFLRMPLVK